MLLSAVQELNAKLTRNDAKLERFVQLSQAEQSEDGVSTGGLGERQGCLTYHNGRRHCVPVTVCVFACCRV